ncbi:MAG: HEAT repeat domain-containing protein [Acidobacteria bacterium]|nr:HEAT repeat domain-containing protein [Acidobacteriota bacterium]
MTVILLIALQSVLFAGSSLEFGQDLDRLNQFIQSQGSSDAATKTFSEARNLIKDGHWAKAEESFNRFIADYPQDKDIAAATYWLAFALKQQSKFKDADKTLTQLIEKFPKSSWVTDARTLRIEIAPRLDEGEKVIAQGGKEDNEEIRLAALQSLFEAKPERGVAKAAEILKPGSGESRLMKEGAIALLIDCEIKQAITVLIDTVRNETDYELRKKAVRALGIHDDESVLDPLKSLVTQSSDKEIARIAVQALGEHQGPRAQALLIEIVRSNADIELRSAAIRGLGDREDESVVNELFKLFTTEKEEAIRGAIIYALAEINLQSAQLRILEIARSAEGVKLRHMAIRALADQEGEKAVDNLIQLYDTEKDEGTKEVILDALGDSEEKKALRKLIDVARKDPSLKLRKKALASIGESDDPEAIKFLEEILKKN